MLRMLAMFAVFAAGSVLALTSFSWGAAFFLWNNLFQPLWFARMPGVFNSGVFVFVMLLVSFLVNAARGLARPRVNLLTVSVGVLSLWMLISALVSPYRSVAMAGLREHLVYWLPVVLISMGLRTRRDVYIVFAGVALSVGLWAAQTGLHLLLTGTPDNTVSVKGGQMSDNNYFMAAVVSVLPMFVWMAFEYRWKWRLPVRWGTLIATALFVASIVFSQSRGATVGLGGLAALYLLLVSKNKVRDGVIIAAVVGAVYLVLPRSFIDRMSTIELSLEQKEGSAKHRVESMLASLRCATDHPLFGVGPGVWMEVSRDYVGRRIKPHSSYTFIPAEIGFVGLAVYLLMVALILRRLLLMRRQSLDEGDITASRFAVCIFCSITGYLLTQIFLDAALISEFLWAQFALATAFFGIWKEERMLYGDPSDAEEEEDGAKEGWDDGPVPAGDDTPGALAEPIDTGAGEHPEETAA